MVPPKREYCCTFKAYVRGEFICQKAYLNKKKLGTSGEILRDIETLDKQYKATGAKSIVGTGYKG